MPSSRSVPFFCVEMPCGKSWTTKNVKQVETLAKLHKIKCDSCRHSVRLVTQLEQSYNPSNSTREQSVFTVNAEMSRQIETNILIN